MLRKFILYLACLLIPWMARGQAAYEGYYWFDGETELQSLGSFQGHAHSFDAEAGHLNQGFHTLHVQVVDTAGVYSPVLTLPFFHVKDQTVMAVRYWFDNDTEHTVRLDYAGDNLLLDVSALEPGLHNLYLQIEDANGVLSDVEHRGFYRQMRRNALTWTYWFDNDESLMTTLPYPGESVMVDISELSEGFHTMHNIVNDITQSSVETRMFVKVPQTEGIGYMNCICSVDGKLVAQEQLPTRGGLLEWTLDVDSLGVGIHKAMFQAITPSGAASTIAERYFVREVTNRELGTMKCLYAIDGHQTYVQAGTMSNGLFHFDLNVDSLEDGLHRIAYMLVSDNGIVTPQKTAFFWKTPLGGSGITQYEYWLNRSENKHVITLDKRTNPFSLISLLPVEAEPVRSECFHFEVKQGVPTMYAKNDFHIAFYDVTGRRVDKSEQYVDYTVQQVVDDIAELQTTQTFERPDSNCVAWFKFEAEKGDTIAFRSSQATSLQVFSPTGQEVYAASADKSVKFGGCHIWEDGTYYVAVHDVTGTRQNVMLDYMHMDRYDVVAQDVYTVGNGGASTITYQGNGFNDLYAVELYNAQGDTIHSQAICYHDNSQISVTFDFTDVKEGKYVQSFCFTNEKKEFDYPVIIESAKPISLSLSVNYPTSFLRGTEAIYTISLTNKGNSTAYYVPMEIAVGVNGSFDAIESIIVTDEENNPLQDDFISLMDCDSIDAETMDFFRQQLKRLQGKQGFIVTKDSISGKEIGHMNCFVTVSPLGNTDFIVKIKSNKTVELKAVIPSDWIVIKSGSGDNYNTNSMVAKSARTASLCCQKEKWECGVNVLANIVGFIPVAGCASALVDMSFFTIFEIACADGTTLGEKELSFYRSVANDKSKLQSVIDRSINGVLSCAAGIIGKFISKLRKELKAAQEAKAAAYASYQEVLKKRDEAYQSYRYLRKKGDDAYQAGKFDEADVHWKSSDEALERAKKYDSEVSPKFEDYKAKAQDVEYLEAKIDEANCKLSDIIDKIKNGISALVSTPECIQILTNPVPNCPPNPGGGGGSSTPVNSFDPNDIYGYTAESGSRFMSDKVQQMDYRIEFENDTTFASASAHIVVIKDTLNANYFDLNSYSPRSVKIGDREESLDGSPQFVRTIDMRPQINAIAQVEGFYDKIKGIITYRFTSIDPMTMEPTDDVMQGFLPVNYDGKSGIGEVAYDVKLRQSFPDGTQIPNKASIIFDTNDPIETPLWVNTIDAVAPAGRVDEAVLRNDTTATIHCVGSDERSGVWKYEVYVQYGSGELWEKVGECPADSAEVSFRVYDGMDYGFCALAVDSAGNVEVKEMAREASLGTYLQGDANADGIVDIEDVVNATRYFLGETEVIYFKAADVTADNQIDIEDVVGIRRIFLTQPTTLLKAPVKRQRLRELLQP